MQADRLTTIAVLALVLAGCGATKVKDGPPRTGSVAPSDLPGDPVPRDEPRSRYGNGPFYRVSGTTYEVMRSSYGYQERGVASWYGHKFHGRLTSSHEPYDMHDLTAAHKTLPLPTYVRVRNLQNNKSVIVRVNDRGPFVDNRLIDLSYSAARRLDMIRDGTSLVEVTAISFDDPPPELPAPATVVASAPTGAIASAPSDAIAAPPAGAAVSEPPAPITDASQSTVYVQVGAFSDPENARRRYALLRNGGVGNAFVLEDPSRSPALFRIRIGPISDVLQYDSLVLRLRNLGILESHLVTE